MGELFKKEQKKMFTEEQLTFKKNVKISFKGKLRKLERYPIHAESNGKRFRNTYQF